jgi:hypothetical protein
MEFVKELDDVTAQFKAERGITNRRTRSVKLQVFVFF